MVEHWEQINSDIGFSQAGSEAAQEAYFVIGSRSGRPLKFDRDALRFVLASASPDHVAYYEDFLGASSNAPAPLQTDAASTGTADVTNSTSQLAIATAASGSDYVTVALGTHFTVSNGWTFFEAVVQVDSVADIEFEVGLSDATTEASGLAFSDHTTAGVTAVADDAALVVFDASGDSNFNALSVNAGGTPQATDGGSAPSATTDYTIRIEVNSGGDAYFYLDGSLVATHTDAVATTAALTPWFTVLTNAASAKTLSVDYVGTVGERS